MHGEEILLMLDMKDNIYTSPLSTNSMILDSKNSFVKLTQLKLPTPTFQDQSQSVDYMLPRVLIARTTLYSVMILALAITDCMP